MTVTSTRSDGGVAFRLDLDTDRLMPGQVAKARWLPTIRLPHSRADAQFHVILAKAWTQDRHLVRDVAVCSTTDL